MHLIIVVTTCLYESLDNDIYTIVQEGFKIPKTYKLSFRKLCSTKLHKSLYGLKQSEQMWYNRLSEYLVKEGYKNNSICPYVFIKKS